MLNEAKTKVNTPHSVKQGLELPPYARVSGSSFIHDQTVTPHSALQDHREGLADFSISTYPLIVDTGCAP